MSTSWLILLANADMSLDTALLRVFGGVNPIDCGWSTEKLVVVTRFATVRTTVSFLNL